jgi:hypothetical protein
MVSRLGPTGANATSNPESGRALVVEIVRGEGRFEGRVSRADERGPATKTLRARDCADLVDALALVAALAIRSDDAAATSDETSSSAPGSPGTPPGPAAATSVSGKASDSGPSASAEGPPGGAALDRARGSRFEVAAGGLLAAGAAPSPIVGGTLGAGWTGADTGFFSPAVGLSVAAGLSPDLAESGGTATFAWFVVRGDLCGLRVALGSALRLRGCLLADAGVLQARGSNTVAPVTSSRGWLSVGAATRLEVPVGARLGIHLVVGVELPLRRDRFAFGSNDFFMVPIAVASGSLSLVAYFR